MLAALTTSTARLLDVRIEQSGRSIDHADDDETTLIVDLDALYGLLLPLPNTAWRRAAGACTRAVTPICSNLSSLISSDLDNVAQLMLDLESHHRDTLSDALPTGLLNPTCIPPTINHDPQADHVAARPLRKRRRSSHPTPPIVIPSSHPSVPTIVITLSSPQSRQAQSSCRVPYQDHAFGNLLTVPSHPTFNKVHPPLALDSSSLPRLDEWEWVDGHWKAVLPSLREQAKKGLFSKPVSLKRRSSRSLCNKNTKPPASAI
ncbi:hypothetical protein BDN70DRAFT_869874 [Pholiota conissans]|uniref:Uncharacterized protein n=1 Tax=Pholiota conissans TaxID=109636 RepID=A0A9P6CZG2_9AGAR|nr:hypothetical protein BDN70DRAFT_869874 [Pholiota conissans]